MEVYVLAEESLKNKQQENTRPLSASTKHAINWNSKRKTVAPSWRRAISHGPLLHCSPSRIHKYREAADYLASLIAETSPILLEKGKRARKICLGLIILFIFLYSFSVVSREKSRLPP